MIRSLLAVLLLPLVGLCSPPEVSFPQSEVKAERHQFVVLKAEVKNGKGATKYRMPKDGLSYLPSSLLNDPSTIVFTPLKDGRYTFWAWSGNEDGGSELAEVTVVVGGGDTTQPPPVKDPDEKDPPAVAGKFYVLLVRANGPVDAKTAAAVRLKAWDEVRKDGHQMKDITRTELEGVMRQAISEDAAKYKDRLDGYVGKAVVLRLSADGKTSSFVDVKELPANDAAVKELVK